MCRRGLSFKGGALYSVFILFIIFSLLIQPLRAAALTEDILDKFAANDIIFYDPEDCDEDPNKICIAPSGDKITWIGDSLTALSTKDRLEKFFPGVDYGPSYNDQSSYVQSGKALTHDNGEDGGPGGVEILRGIASRNKLRPFLVFALGANEPWTEQTLKDVLDLAGSSQVIIVTSRTINYTSSYHYDYAKENEMLLEKAKTEDNLSVGDWASEVKDEWYASDGMHYVDAGYDAYLQFIKDTLPKSCSGSLCGDTAPQKYWSALTQHFGVAPAAGIMGNIDSEGGYNPVGVESCTWLNPYDFDTNSWTNGWPSFEYYRDNDYSQKGDPTGVGAFGITATRSDYLNHINEVAPDLMKYFSDPSTYSLGGCSGLPMNGAETGGDALLALIGDMIRSQSDLSTLEFNDAVIRDGTYHERVNGNDGSASFIVDIDSVKQTYEVKIIDTDEELTDLAVQITCPHVSKSKYPDSVCEGIYGGTSKKVEKHIPYEMKLDTGEKIIVKNLEPTMGGSKLLHIYLYSCDEKDPLITETKDAVHAWVKSLGDESSEFYTYDVRAGYCEGDTI